MYGSWTFDDTDTNPPTKIRFRKDIRKTKIIAKLFS